MTLMDDFDMEDVEMEEEAQPADNGNRTFILVAGILGGVFLLSLVCMAVYAMVYLPRTREAKATEIAEIYAQNTEVAMMSALTAEAESWTATPSSTPTKAPQTPASTNTPVVAPTETPKSGIEGIAPTVDPRTATVAALFTQQAVRETTTPMATELPDTGFADDVGIPGMLTLAISLVLVIILARRLRTAS